MAPGATTAQFESELADAARANLHPVDRPAIGRSHAAVLQWIGDAVAPNEHSNWYEAEVIDPFFGVRGCPDQQKIFDCGAYVEVLGYDYDARTQPLLAEAGEMRGHGLAIMGNQNPFRFRRDPEHVRIAKADNTALMSAQDIDQRFPPAQAQDDLVVEIGVRQESRPHAVGVGVLLRASASFA
jgi:hypothetical protein